MDTETQLRHLLPLSRALRNAEVDVVGRWVSDTAWLVLTAHAGRTSAWIDCRWNPDFHTDWYRLSFGVTRWLAPVTDVPTAVAIVRRELGSGPRFPPRSTEEAPCEATMQLPRIRP